MSESISRRVGRLISGSINALMDAAENASPTIIMQESITEIDSAINEVRHELGKVLVQENMTQERIKTEQNRHQTLTEHIEVALKENREDLAQAAISKQMDIEAQLPILKGSLEKALNEIKELEGFISALQAKKREMQEELNHFSKQTPTQQESSIENKVTKAESAFNRVMGMNSPQHNHTDESKLAELEELTRKNRIHERLSALKAAQE